MNNFSLKENNLPLFIDEKHKKLYFSFLFILLLFFLYSCSSQGDKDFVNKNPSVQVDEQSKIISDKNDTIQDSVLSNIVFIYEDDTFKQTVKLCFINEKKIKFQFISENKIKKQNAFIEGIAKNISFDLDLDCEIDEDEDGVAYPVNSYIYKEKNERNCWLAFRIDMESNSIMRINEADCKKQNPNCPFYSVGLLLRQ